jgi:hypothetical protein
MVGEGVLHICLNDPAIEQVLVINRRPCGVKHAKLEEAIHKDFHDFSALKDRITGYNACYFCMGVSSMGMKEDKFHSLTYDITMAMARIFASVNPSAVFCYISGAGTDSSEKGRTMWARVKGKTENHVMDLFPQGYAFRPGYIQPIKGMKNSYRFYKYTSPFYPILKTLFPGYVCSLEDIGRSMIHVTLNPHEPRILECKDITSVAKNRE